MQLGIDFGTTRTVVAAADRGNYPILTFDSPDGAHYEWFPSLLAVHGAERCYGWEAWSRQQDPAWTIVRSVKRVLDDAGPHTILASREQNFPLMQRPGRDGGRHCASACPTKSWKHAGRSRQR